MNEYNFNVLTWGEFEEFTKDLLSEEMGVSFQAFADGADGGIDLRYSACDNDRTIVVQCKRYKSVSGLMANLAKERLKLDEMSPAPERYILSVSLDLTEDKIDDIVTLFSPYIKQSSDILTPKQLNSLLHKHPSVEKRHYKLWIASSNVLQTILSSRVSNYSGLIKEKIIDTLETYSPTPSFNEAMLTLKEHGFIVIAGEPGVGKTTLADVMSYYLLGEGDFNELVALPQDINDALEMMSSDPDKKQIFLFDDFLGSNYLDDKLSRREDGIFKTLIENAGRLRKNKALIMTTREYILHQAQQSTEVFKDQGFLDAKYIVANSLILFALHNTGNPYEDKWDDQGVMHYTGMGLSGDQSIDYAQNKTLAESRTNGVDVHLFESFEPKEYIYRGQVQLVGDPYYERQKDEANNQRQVVKFPLRLSQQ